MLSNMRMLDREDENDEGDNVTWEDQNRINTFSKLNSRLRTIDEKLKELKHDKEALDDLAMELELADEDEAVMYKIGETFLHLSHPQATKLLTQDQAELDVKVSKYTDDAEECSKQMALLKTTLYAKFGKSINLDD